MFWKFLLSRDLLGRANSINFKGEDSYNTKVGAVLSIGILIIVLIQLIKNSVNLTDMRDPSILQYSRLIYESEASDLDEINLNEYQFNVGFYFVDPNNSTHIVQLPESIGRFVTGVRNPANAEKKFSTAAVNCTGLFA